MGRGPAGVRVSHAAALASLDATPRKARAAAAFFSHSGGCPATHARAAVGVRNACVAPQIERRGARRTKSPWCVGNGLGSAAAMARRRETSTGAFPARKKGTELNVSTVKAPLNCTSNSTHGDPHGPRLECGAVLWAAGWHAAAPLAFCGVFPSSVVCVRAYGPKHGNIFRDLPQGTMPTHHSTNTHGNVCGGPMETRCAGIVSRCSDSTCASLVPLLFHARYWPRATTGPKAKPRTRCESEGASAATQSPVTPQTARSPPKTGVAAVQQLAYEGTVLAPEHRDSIAVVRKGHCHSALVP